MGSTSIVLKKTKRSNKNIQTIQLFVFDIDGVITDGKKYTDGLSEWKSIQMKDLDALNMIKEEGYYLGCISGEKTLFSQQFEKMDLDFICLGCKNKLEALDNASKQFYCSLKNVCYIGDGKYDIPVLKEVGLSICPNDAIAEVKKEVDIILSCNGGEGCIAEIYSILKNQDSDWDKQILFDLKTPMLEHRDILGKMLLDNQFIHKLDKATRIILNSFLKGGKLFLCGNGGSAGDAQHIAAELVGRFYLERRAWNAEALTTNTSILTSLANDYDYDMIFSRQIEAKAARGDVLIGITTSGTSRNIMTAVKTAKKMGVKTILLTGRMKEEVRTWNDLDCCIDIPSVNTPRIQEMHILIGHMICEAVEYKLVQIQQDELIV